jgi:hypothetical protein
MPAPNGTDPQRESPIAKIVRDVDENLKDEASYSLWKSARLDFLERGDRGLESYIRSALDEAREGAAAALERLQELVKQGRDS